MASIKFLVAATLGALTASFAVHLLEGTSYAQYLIDLDYLQQQFGPNRYSTFMQINGVVREADNSTHTMIVDTHPYGSARALTMRIEYTEDTVYASSFGFRDSDIPLNVVCLGHPITIIIKKEEGFFKASSVSRRAACDPNQRYILEV